MKTFVAILLAILILLFPALHWTGNQPRLDAVAVAQRDTGIPLESSRVDVGDVTLHVVQAGPADGPPVLLLHGFPEFWYAWRDIIPLLAAAGYRVIVRISAATTRATNPRRSRRTTSIVSATTPRT
jgi:hypothetical protein